MKRSAFALGIAAALVFSGFAHAEEVRKIEVRYSDLDLSRAEQANVLYSRIQKAAHDVCATRIIPRAERQLFEERCRMQAVGDAVHHVDNPNLTAVYLNKAGKRAMLASNR
jgi:UrcA family protein